ATIDYYSSLQASQALFSNVYSMTQNTRNFGGNIVGAWNAYSLNATVAHNEYFTNTTDSVLSGSWPRVAFTRNERPIPGTPLYFSLSTDLANMLASRRYTETDTGNEVEINNSVGRLDVNPQLRFPFKKWQFLTVNSTVSWRDTYYTRSYKPV